MVGCVRNTAYNGVYNENPFNYEHVNLSNIAVHIDGQSDTVPSLDPDFTNSLYRRCFHYMFGGAGKVNTDEDLDVSRAHTINVIVYAEYENVIPIDSARDVLLDYSN